MFPLATVVAQGGVSPGAYAPLGTPGYNACVIPTVEIASVPANQTGTEEAVQAQQMALAQVPANQRQRVAELRQRQDRVNDPRPINVTMPDSQNARCYRSQADLKASLLGTVGLQALLAPGAAATQYGLEGLFFDAYYQGNFSWFTYGGTC